MLEFNDRSYVDKPSNSSNFKNDCWSENWKKKLDFQMKANCEKYSMSIFYKYDPSLAPLSYCPQTFYVGSVEERSWKLFVVEWTEG